MTSFSQRADTEYVHWRARLAGAQNPEFWPIEAVDEALEQGWAQFWCDGQAALVTSPRTYPGGAVVLEGIAACGDMRALWESIAPAVERWGRASGLKKLHAMGRWGWTRAALPHGWKTEMTVIEKEL